MTFVKLVKSNAYFKRYQVKYRRRREGKTDYYARKRLVVQDKNKYMTPRFRLVVRITNTTVVCQVVYSEIDGDHVLASAYSSELPRYGLKVGLKNYAASYCTGLLCARRVLKKLELDQLYGGASEVTGEIETSEDYTASGKKKIFFVPELNDERRPFRCVLDVGIQRTTTGARVFGALKGAVDGGLDIPHSEKRFPGYDREEKAYAPEAHRDRIFGQHVAEYMRLLQENDADKYQKHFSEYIKNGIDADKLEDLYKTVHENIRKDPAPSSKSTFAFDKKFKNPNRLTNEERKARVAAKKEKRIAELMAQQ